RVHVIRGQRQHQFSLLTACMTFPGRRAGRRLERRQLPALDQRGRRTGFQVKLFEGHRQRGGVAAMAVDDDDLVESMPMKAVADVLHELAEDPRAHRDGAGKADVLTRVAIWDRWSCDN